MLKRDAEELTTTPDPTQQLPQMPSGKSPPSQCCCSKKLGESKCHSCTRRLSQCLTEQGRRCDWQLSHQSRLYFWHWSQMRRQARHEESHCSSACCLVSGTHNKCLVGSKVGWGKGVFSSRFRKKKKVSYIPPIKTSNHVKTTVFLKLKTWPFKTLQIRES